MQEGSILLTTLSLHLTPGTEIEVINIIVNYCQPNTICINAIQQTATNFETVKHYSMAFQSYNNTMIGYYSY